MEIKQITDSAQYNDFVQNHPQGHFMQSTYWLALKAKFGWSVYGRYIIENNGVVYGAFGILQKKKFGVSILYIPRGPLWDSSDAQATQLLLNKLQEISRKEKPLLIRISPAYLETDENIKKLLRDSGFIYSKKQLQTKATVLIDLAKTEEEIMASFHEKTRYNIRLAVKKGVQVSTIKTVQELQEWYALMQKMAVRQGYNLQSYEYYLHILEQTPIAKIYVAKTSDNKLIGGIVVFTYAKKTHYMYGAFDYEYRNLMGNYLIHWQVMQDAKGEGNLFYDLQGIPLIKDENHPMYGFYRFKKGFNGQEVEYIGEYDYPLNKFIYNIWNSVQFEKNLYLE